MSFTVSLVPYLIRVRERRKKVTYFPIEQIPFAAGTQPFLSWFTAYLGRRQTQTKIDDDNKRAFKVVSHGKKDRHVWGSLEAGIYGYEAELRNIKTNNKKTRTPTDCEYLPYYFSVHVRKSATFALLLTQNLGSHGVKTVLYDDLAEALKVDAPKLLLEMNPIVSRDLVDTMIANGATKIEYVATSQAADVADRVAKPEWTHSVGSLSVVVRAKRDGRFAIPQPIIDVFRGKRTVNEVLEINNIHYDDVRITMFDAHKPRTVRLKTLGELAMNHDITAEVTFKNGLPTLESVHPVASDFASELQRTVLKGM